MSCPRCNAPAADETLREFGGVCPKCLLDFSEEQDAPAFPNLEILEMLGQGGMGVVYKAVQKNLGRTVALKVLSPQLSDDPEFVERFTREARALASLSHPNIVGIYDSGIHDHVPYLVMEYVDGTPLRKMLASKKMTPGRVLEVIPQICDALHYAHEHGVVHRDIKPENILVDREGRVKIADFGLAKLASLDETRITRTGYVMGSPHYMAPEQFEHSGRVDHRADIYSLGVVFYEMLTGEVPMGRFKAPSEKAAVDQRLDPVVLKSLEREPDDRWQSVDEVKSRVTGLDGDPVRPKSGEGKIRTLMIVGAVIGPSALCAFLLLFLSKGEAPGSRVTSTGWEAGLSNIAILAIVAIVGIVTIVIVTVSLILLSRRKRIEAAKAKPFVDPRPAWRAFLRPLREPEDAALPARGLDRGAKIAFVVTGVVMALASVFIWWITRDRMQESTWGPIMVAVVGVLTLVFASGPLRGSRGKRLEPMTKARSQNMAVAAAAGAIVLVSIGVLLFATEARKPPPPTPPKTVVIHPVTKRPVFVNAESVDFVWPSSHDLGEEFADAVTVQDETLLTRWGFPAEVAKYLEYSRELEVLQGRVRAAGFQFATDTDRTLWEKDPSWRTAVKGWYRLSFGRRATILIQHDNTPEGRAAAKRIETIVERNLSAPR